MLPTNRPRFGATLHHTAKELRKQVENASREAQTDALTGIGNRKHFDLRLKRCMHEAIEQDTELTLLLMDIDHFKNFNDAYGHQFGDLVPKLVSRSMVEGIKGRELAARYRGEESAEPAMRMERDI